MGKTPQHVAAEYALGNLDVERVPWYAAHWLADGWDAPLLRELAGLDHTEPRQVDERTLSEHVSAFVSWNLDLDAIWRTPFTDLHVLVDEWDQGWGRGNQELATTVRQLCVEHQQR
ncbi:hypothetical protein [Phytohabitans aurantiacus]|uniref:Uncharacterized protein n=1 Tax=Phytohabitans aurantiacus TaxID=3016789 RepID=A0ABQ5R1C7_9ACTN|nr:hypothetical protein [Phytohabitans aurantiacus]GLI00609.1 hypothetical protein Pa4123_58850 [Phytohabitans aurantiacus]